MIQSQIYIISDQEGFRRSERVIEAVFVDLELKQLLLRRTEELTASNCIFAPDTSSLPISKIASVSRWPDFFSPVHKMPLLEVIATEQTCDQAIVTAVTFGKRVEKQAIVVCGGEG